jgi:hypothetical protein
VYDDKMNYLLLFGGHGAKNAIDVNDTWAWNGVNWTQMHPVTSPSPRNGASLAYDATTGQVILFGGSSTKPVNGEYILGDTWIWDGRNWTQMHPSVSPPARAAAGMTYDAATQQVILFGGGGAGPRTNSPLPPSLDDTWTWDGSNWTQQQPAVVPPARQSPNIAYDAVVQKVVLFGGVSSDLPWQPLQDTWTWDGTNWTQLNPATSPASSLTVNGNTLSFECRSSMVYDPSTHRTMLICLGLNLATEGITTEQQRFEAVWTWDGTNWTQQNVLGPDDAYSYGILTYDTALGAVIEFSSFLPKTKPLEYSYISEDQLWKWNGQGWDNLESWNT